MMTVLSEIRGIEDTVDTMNVKMENMQSKVDSMQEENMLWKQKLGVIEQDVSDIKHWWKWHRT